MGLDKSKEIMKYSIVALVFVIFYFVTGVEDAVGNTMQSVILVFIAGAISWAVIREQRKKGALKAL